MVCPKCGAKFKVREVKEQLYFDNNVDYDDLPERLCSYCALAYIQENSVTLFEGTEYDIDDPEYHY